MDREVHEDNEGGVDQITDVSASDTLGGANPCTAPERPTTPPRSNWVTLSTFKAEHPSLETLDIVPDLPRDVEAQSDSSKARTVFRRIREKLGLSSPFTNKYNVPEIIRAVDELPDGYGRVASYMTCDKNFLLYRRFGWLHNHILLDLQDEIQMLEAELEKYHKENQDVPVKLASRRLDYESNPSRKELIRTIKEKLRDYHESLILLQQISNLNTPTRRLQNSLYNIIEESYGMTAREKEWVLQRNDLAAVAGNGAETWLSGFIEDVLYWMSRRLLLAVFRTRDQKAQSGKEKHILLVSKERLALIPRIILTVVACCLLLVPVLILFKLQPSSQSDVQRQGNLQVLTIFIFTLVFAACCSIFTKAKPQEVFTASAAYCAVLVVFLGNSTNVMMVTSVDTTSGG